MELRFILVKINVKYELTQLDNRVHGAYTSQNALQLVLSYVSQPFRDGIVDHLVYTKKTAVKSRKKRENNSSHKSQCSDENTYVNVKAVNPCKL